MGEFIKVEIDQEKCAGIQAAEKMVQVCPVNIFKIEEQRAVVEAENEDECTLCMLCFEAFPPGTITIHKLYDEQATGLNGSGPVDA